MFYLYKITKERKNVTMIKYPPVMKNKVSFRLLKGDRNVSLRTKPNTTLDRKLQIYVPLPLWNLNKTNLLFDIRMQRYKTRFTATLLSVSIETFHWHWQYTSKRQKTLWLVQRKDLNKTTGLYRSRHRYVEIDLVKDTTPGSKSSVSRTSDSHLSETLILKYIKHFLGVS